MVSLVEKAKASTRGRKHRAYSPDELQLVEAWLSGEVGFTQVAEVMQFNRPMTTYTFLAIGAREIWRRRAYHS